MPSLTFAGSSVGTIGSVGWRPSVVPSAVQAASAAETRMRSAALRIGHGSQAFVRGSAQRQPDPEVGAGLAILQELDRAAVCLNALGNDGQPDAGSADRTSLRPPALIEGFEDSRAIFGMHARTVVADVHDEIVALHARTDVDRAASRSELDG